MTVCAADYREAWSEFRAADEKLRSLAKYLSEFVKDITECPDQTCFSGLPDEPLPKLDEIMGGHRWDAKLFPQPEHLQAAIRRRLYAKARLRLLWDSMSPVMRYKAPAPPGINE